MLLGFTLLSRHFHKRVDDLRLGNGPDWADFR
jgi:hypothetical protein